MIDFFRLYINDNVFATNSLGIVMLILYANAIMYLIDFYNLVKRKSQAETLALMSIPLVVSLCGSALVALLLSVPRPGELNDFILVLNDYGLCLKLVGIVAVYVMLWLITYFSQNKRSRKEVRTWVVSCTPDYCFSMVIIICTVCRLTVGIDFFEYNNQFFLWLYIYCILFLSCKVFLLIVGNLVRFYSMKITVFRWTEKKNPALFLVGYFLFCQNAIARNTLLFELGILIPLTISIHKEGWSEEMISMMAFLYLGAAFVVVYSVKPVTNGLSQFSRWGDVDKIKRKFCDEYFVERVLYRDDNFTVTQHFLIAEQRPAEVYYWPCIRYISGWVIGKAGKYRELCFTDGKICRLTPDEVATSEQIFKYAQRYLDIKTLEL